MPIFRSNIDNFSLFCLTKFHLFMENLLKYKKIKHFSFKFLLIHYENKQMGCGESLEYFWASE